MTNSSIHWVGVYEMILLSIYVVGVVLGILALLVDERGTPECEKTPASMAALLILAWPVTVFCCLFSLLMGFTEPRP
ncbi:hypothetical protein ASE99_10810 [Serratia sp. Leaf51]|nr:hypothetical protein ASE99_10810 [Serratia sp. Leaf51]